jgi:hypothetical protein
MHSRYTRVVAQKMTTTVIETALAGGGGLVKTLRHSYSWSDLRGDQLGPDEASGGSGYQPLEEEDGAVQRRTLRGRSRAATGHALSMADDGEGFEAWREERRSDRRRKTSSLYGTLPRAGVGVGSGFSKRNGSQYGTLPRNGSQYGTLPRRAKKQRRGLPNFEPLDRRPAQSKDDLIKDEPESDTLSNLKRHNSTKGSLRKNKVSKI